jgi:DNA-binding NarL/FixJ family response regulator
MVPPRALAVVAEYICHGSFGEAATCLDLSVQTVKNHAASAIATTKAASTANAAFRLGWVKFPQGVGHILDCRNWEGDGI